MISLCIDTIHYSILILCYAHPRARVLSFTPLPCCPCTSVWIRPCHPYLLHFLFILNDTAANGSLLLCFPPFPHPSPFPSPPQCSSVPSPSSSRGWLLYWLQFCDSHFLSILDCVPIMGSSSTMKDRDAVPPMYTDEGQRARTSTKRTDDDERGRRPKGMDETTEEDKA